MTVYILQYVISVVTKLFYVSLSLQDQYTPVTIAAQNGHASIVDMLLAHGANVNHVTAVSYVIHFY